MGGYCEDLKKKLTNAVFLIFYAISGVWVDQIFFAYQSIDIMLTLCLCPVAVYYAMGYVYTGDRIKAVKSIILMILSLWCYQAIMLLYIAGCAAIILLIDEQHIKADLKPKEIIIRIILLISASAIFYLIIDNLVRIFIFHAAKGNHIEGLVNLRYGKIEIFKTGYTIIMFFFRHIPRLTDLMDKFIISSGATEASSLNTSHYQFNNPYYAVSSLIFFPGFVYFICLFFKLKKKLFSWFVMIVMMSTLIIFVLVGGGHCPVISQFSIPFVTAFVIWYDLDHVSSKYAIVVYFAVFLSAYFMTQRSSLLNTSDWIRMKEDEKIADLIADKARSEMNEPHKILIIKEQWVNPYNPANYQQGESTGNSVFFSFMNGRGVTFINLVEGTDFEAVTDDEKRNELFEKSKSIPAYPSRECLQIIDDTLVVKLTEGGSADELY